MSSTHLALVVCFFSNKRTHVEYYSRNPFHVVAESPVSGTLRFDVTVFVPSESPRRETLR